MYSLRNLFFSICVFFLCLLKPKSFPLFICFALDFFFSFLWHFSNKNLEIFFKKCFLSKNPKLALNIQYLWRARRSVQGAEDGINSVTCYCGKHTWPGKAGSRRSSWQMGPCRILQSVVPPYGGGPPAPDMQKTHVPAVFSPRHLRPPTPSYGL